MTHRILLAVTRFLRRLWQRLTMPQFADELERQMRENHGIRLERANELADELKRGNAKWPRRASVTAFVRRRDRVLP